MDLETAREQYQERLQEAITYMRGLGDLHRQLLEREFRILNNQLITLYQNSGLANILEGGITAESRVTCDLATGWLSA
jgi:hypothetical protein